MSTGWPEARLGPRRLSTGEHPERPGGEIRPICLWPVHAGLATPARQFGSALADHLALPQLLADMEATMFAAAGVGLAAPQIGVNLRVAVIAIDNQLIEMVNPVLLEASGELAQKEGCLSVAPGETLVVTRPERVTMGFFTPAGEWRVEVAEGLLARAFQHERDHLDGILYPNRVGPVGREIIRGKAKKFNRAAGNTWMPGGGR